MENTENNIASELPTEHPTEGVIEKTETSIEKIEQEKKELQDKYLRLVAEFDNYKKRNARERIELLQTANKEVIVSLLDTLDDCERASMQFESETDSTKIKEGASLIFNKLKNVLTNKGLKKFESKEQIFDIEQHEAITEIEVLEEQKGKVIDVVQDGYNLNEKLIRFAKVVVGK